VEVVADVVLVFEEPVDGGFVAHGFGDGFGGGGAVGLEEDFVIDFRGFVGDAGVEPDGDDDAQVVSFGFGDDAATDAVEDGIGDGGLHGAHEDVGVAGGFDGDLADHDGGGLDLHIAVEDGEDAAMSFDLIADEVGERVADGAIEFADDDFGLGGRPCVICFDEGFAGAHDDAIGGLRRGFERGFQRGLGRSFGGLAR